MSSVISAMVGRERTLRRPRRHHATAIAAPGDPVFVAWHKTRIMWLRQLLKGLRKRRMANARKYLAYIQDRYPEESTQLGLDNANVEELARPGSLKELKDARRLLERTSKRLVAEELRKRRGL